jgi:hypothetical protein
VPFEWRTREKLSNTAPWTVVSDTFGAVACSVERELR